MAGQDVLSGRHPLAKKHPILLAGPLRSFETVAEVVHCQDRHKAKQGQARLE